MKWWHCFTWLVLLENIYCDITSKNEFVVGVNRRIRDVSSNSTKIIPADSSTNVKEEIKSAINANIVAAIKTSTVQPVSISNGNATKTKSIPPTAPPGVFIVKSRPPDDNYNNRSFGATPEENYDISDGGKSPNADIPGQPKFDENAVQRSLIVVAGLAFILMLYFGAKFMLLKKRKVNNKRYGRIDSEIDLLDEIEDESDEEEELFDLNATRRSQL